MYRKNQSSSNGKEREREDEVEEKKVKASEQPCDTRDPCDKVGEGAKVENENENENENEEGRGENSINANETPNPSLSHMSHMSHSNSVYADFITEEHLPSLNRTVYRRKEHPEIPYYELEGIEESHFKPYHTDF